MDVLLTRKTAQDFSTEGRLVVQQTSQQHIIVNIGYDHNSLLYNKVLNKLVKLLKTLHCSCLQSPLVRIMTASVVTGRGAASF